jgi:hypothetical protein
MDDEQQDDDLRREHGATRQVAKAGAEMIAQLQPIDEGLDDDETGEGGKRLLLEAERRQGSGFAESFRSARFHGQAVSFLVWLFCSGITLPNWEPLVSFLNQNLLNNLLFLNVTRGAIQRQHFHHPKVLTPQGLGPLNGPLVMQP